MAKEKEHQILEEIPPPPDTQTVLSDLSWIFILIFAILILAYNKKLLRFIGKIRTKSHQQSVNKWFEDETNDPGRIISNVPFEEETSNKK